MKKLLLPAVIGAIFMAPVVQAHDYSGIKEFHRIEMAQKARAAKIAKARQAEALRLKKLREAELAREKAYQEERRRHRDEINDKTDELRLRSMTSSVEVDEQRARQVELETASQHADLEMKQALVKSKVAAASKDLESDADYKAQQRQLELKEQELKLRALENKVNKEKEGIDDAVKKKKKPWYKVW